MSADAKFTVANAKKTLWLVRPDLKKLYEPLGSEEQDVLLLVNHLWEYPGLASDEKVVQRVTEQLSVASEKVSCAELGGLFSRLLDVFWRTRDDVHTQFDLSSCEGQVHWVWWFFLHAVPESNLFALLSPIQKRFLDAPAEVLPDGFALSNLAHQVWLRRADLQQMFDLDKEQDVAGMMVWFLRHGVVEMNLWQYIDAEMAKVWLQGDDKGLPVLARHLWCADAALQQRFPCMDSDEYVQWFETDAHNDLQIVAYLRELLLKECEPLVPLHRNIVRVGKPVWRGVNLVGHAQGQFGVGEDVRMAALALRSQGIPFSIFNVPTDTTISMQGDQSLESLFDDRMPFDTTLFCTTGLEMASIAARYGNALFAGRKTIGYWPWELAEWSQELLHVYELVDELWASSRFAYEAFIKSSPKPVKMAPMVVDVSATDGKGRQQFGLRRDTFYFVFSFDAVSSVYRKNPLAVIQAFQKAFPLGSETVGLVLKVIRAEAGAVIWQQVQDIVASDPRLHIVSETLSRGTLLDLYRACDCFVSLHRSEGFGRNIAEAMALGKPVIATGYSGNQDFTLSGTAGVVDYTLSSVANGEYPFASGQVWAEPDTEQAAQWMQLFFNDAFLAQRLAANGRYLVQSTYSATFVGEQYKLLLN